MNQGRACARSPSGDGGYQVRGNSSPEKISAMSPRSLQSGVIFRISRFLSRSPANVDTRRIFRPYSVHIKRFMQKRPSHKAQLVLSPATRHLCDATKNSRHTLEISL